MAADCSELFVGLAVIINDWSVLTQPSTSITDSNTANTPADSECSSAAPADAHDYVGENNWRSNLEDVLDDFWSNVTSSVKKRVRKACVEVLKRTSEPETPEMMEIDSRKADESHLLD